MDTIETSAEHDLQALRGAAEFFDNIATGANPAPLAFAQAIRRAISELELTADIAAALSDDSPLSEEESAAVNSSWDRFKASFPVAKVINDNQPDNQAIIQVLCEPPTIPVGTLLFSSLQAAKDNALALELFEALE